MLLKEYRCTHREVHSGAAVAGAEGVREVVQDLNQLQLHSYDVMVLEYPCWTGRDRKEDTGGVEKFGWFCGLYLASSGRGAYKNAV